MGFLIKEVFYCIEKDLVTSMGLCEVFLSTIYSISGHVLWLIYIHNQICILCDIGDEL